MKEKLEKKKEKVKEFVKKNWKKALVYGAAGYGVYNAAWKIYWAYRGFEGCDLHFHSNVEEECIDLDVWGVDRFGKRYGQIKGTHISVDEMASLRDWINETIDPLPESEKTE